MTNRNDTGDGTGHPTGCGYGDDPTRTGYHDTTGHGTDTSRTQTTGDGTGYTGDPRNRPTSGHSDSTGNGEPR